MRLKQTGLKHQLERGLKSQMVAEVASSGLLGSADGPDVLVQ